jgi:ABC-2 type transport system permease protein
MRDALGLSVGLHGMTGFIATGFYGVTFVIFMIILCSIAANQLMVNLVDRGSMVQHLFKSMQCNGVFIIFCQVLLALV